MPHQLRQFFPPHKPVQKISFAQPLSTSTIPTASNDNLPQPLIRGDSVSIHITQDIYEKGAWSMTTLGRGYYEFFFSSQKDMCMTWAMGTINLKLGVLRLFEWEKDFNMHKQCNTHAQVWIRILELPQEYWMDRTLREIASDLGTPLLIDSATSKRIYGHYARILVDMDFSRQIFHEITVEREGYAFQVEVAYEWLSGLLYTLGTYHYDTAARYSTGGSESRNYCSGGAITLGHCEEVHQSIDNVAIPVVDDINEHHDIDINATINVEAYTEQQEDTITISPSLNVMVNRNIDISQNYPLPSSQ
ncbi:DUF4283 domain protein [Medicago truncatula]|uniref:DUF4283 domain protein n=1 Tax=Medicago truncatula TaxID=3880 RepID=A0A072V174_MEDTR|nr:DUF4283 domain protein [Medicago truncatula]